MQGDRFFSISAGERSNSEWFPSSLCSTFSSHFFLCFAFCCSCSHCCRPPTWRTGPPSFCEAALVEGRLLLLQICRLLPVWAAPPSLYEARQPIVTSDFQICLSWRSSKQALIFEIQQPSPSNVPISVRFLQQCTATSPPSPLSSFLCFASYLFYHGDHHQHSFVKSLFIASSSSIVLRGCHLLLLFSLILCMLGQTRHRSLHDSLHKLIFLPLLSPSGSQQDCHPLSSWYLFLQ